jgi:two-component system, LytTR family, sensor kinase
MYGFTILGFLLSYLLFLSIDVLNFKFLFPLLKILTPRDAIDWLEFIKYSSFWYTFVLIVAYANMISNISLERTMVNNQLNKVKLSKELDILKNQFHSHLNFNFLNFCYSSMLKISKEKAEMISHYSDMLSYNLQYHAKKRIPITKEIEYIQNLINLQSFLVGENYHQLKINIDQPHYEVAPLLLGVLMEQAYKRAVLNEKENPMISELIIHNGVLQFTIQYLKESKYNSVIDPSISNNLNPFLSLNYKHGFAFQTSQSDNKIVLLLNIDLNV